MLCAFLLISCSPRYIFSGLFFGWFCDGVAFLRRTTISCDLCVWQPGLLCFGGDGDHITITIVYYYTLDGQRWTEGADKKAVNLPRVFCFCAFVCLLCVVVILITPHSGGMRTQSVFGVLEKE